MKILDPALGGKLRALITVLTIVAAVITAVESSGVNVAWVASAGLAVRGVLDVLTHFTAAGNVDQNTAG